MALVIHSSDLVQALDQETLTVTGLQPGTYQLRVDDRVVGSFSAEKLGRGVNLALLETRHARLLQTAAALDPSRLREPVAGKNYTIDHMLRGVAQHMAYHAGQIALIKRLVATAGPTAAP